MCEKAFKENDRLFKYVPDWLLQLRWLKTLRKKNLLDYKRIIKLRKLRSKRNSHLSHDIQTVSLSGALIKTRKKLLKSCGGLMSNEKPRHS